MEARLGPLLRGAASFLAPSLGTFHRVEPASTVSADYCYSMFLRHLSYVLPLSGRVPSIVIELGPGSSIGMGVAALIAGASRYLALDIIDHTDAQRDCAIFDRLVELFRARTPISDTGGDRNLFPPPLSWSFPEVVAQDLDELLAEDRIAALRSAILRRQGGVITVAAPWGREPPLGGCTADWIFSHAVLMYVDDIESLIGQFGDWLAPHGVMTHQIDYTSSNLTRHRNGHWALSDFATRVLRGRRPHLLNRLPHSAYIDAFRARGYDIDWELRDVRASDIGRERLALAFREMSDRDLETAEGFLVCRAP